MQPPTTTTKINETTTRVASATLGNQNPLSYLITRESESPVIFDQHVKRPSQQERRVAKVTADKYLDIARGLYGWMHNINGVPLEGLTLRAVFPSSKRGDVEMPFQYVQWLVTERKVAATYELTNLHVMISLAKFLFDDESSTNPAEGDLPYSDIDVIRLLRQMANDAKARSKVARPVSDVNHKWLEWEEFLNVVETLRRECSPRTKTGKRRTATAIAWSIQRYLIFSILSCVPDRQRTIRELQLGKTLQRKGDNYVIVHGPEDYKTGNVYGDRPPLVIASWVTLVLEEFIQRKSRRKTKTPYIFTRKNGAPLTDIAMHRLFTSTTFRLTGGHGHGKEPLTNPQPQPRSKVVEVLKMILVFVLRVVPSNTFFEIASFAKQIKGSSLVELV
ncbi:hypothetical protein CYMTET_37251 [Cymbomonas tetramitiformis]|uniref:Uncharacterized protein n=1 Tax=Cymbomonas tetramitiformis TaxID=36881 RepID=A0AAE0CFS1_9CHLO|nr:hypothetical protein CYMTET_37251 [Cymbomonas tetramitiformis]